MLAYFLLCGNFSLLGLNKSTSLSSLDIVEAIVPDKKQGKIEDNRGVSERYAKHSNSKSDLR